MRTKIHTYTSNEPMLKVNAFIVETSKELVIVDTTLTMSDSLSLKKMADGLGQSLLPVLFLHMGIPTILPVLITLHPTGNLPIYALPSVKKLMQETEEAKHKQWSAMFGRRMDSQMGLTPMKW
jgi:hypothetical protein